uniref:Glutamine amidotransferase type-2 domain-containing protein n=1 Tax=candidate division WOR-3 bacterium TaxID=2052148 RepID=A0A7V3ZX17_UNCW3
MKEGVLSCGIFGYVGRSKVKLSNIKSLLKELENLKEEVDNSPLGGHGAGYFHLSDGLVVYHNRVGYYENRSPVDVLFELGEFSPDDEVNFFAGHVRRASDEFSKIEDLDELHAQPFIHVGRKYRVIGIHNGFLRNYKELAEKFKIEEYFTDSDVLTRVFLNILEKKDDISESCEELFSSVEGGNTAVFLVERRDNYWLVILHTGKTRGLVIYENTLGEILFCSRRGPLLKHFGNLISNRNFFESVYIPPKEQNLFINWWRIETDPPFRLSEY